MCQDEDKLDDDTFSSTEEDGATSVDQFVLSRFLSLCSLSFAAISMEMTRNDSDWSLYFAPSGECLYRFSFVRGATPPSDVSVTCSFSLSTEESIPDFPSSVSRFSVSRLVISVSLDKSPVAVLLSSAVTWVSWSRLFPTSNSSFECFPTTVSSVPFPLSLPSTKSIADLFTPSSVIVPKVKRSVKTSLSQSGSVNNFKTNGCKISTATISRRIKRPVLQLKVSLGIKAARRESTTFLR